MSRLDRIPPGTRSLRVHPVTQLEGTIALPGSKSLTNRALIVASLAKGESLLRNVLDCDDSQHLVSALRSLGIFISWDTAESTLTIRGAGGPYVVRQGQFYAGNAGTAVRFLTGALAATGGKFVVDGDERMRQRPIADLVVALRGLGAAIEAPSGCPPVEINGSAMTGGRISIPGNTSSQFISSILLAAAIVPEAVELRVTDTLVSRPYLDLTFQVIRAFGGKVSVEQDRSGHPVFRVHPVGAYAPREFVVEGDASAASYFYGAAAITGSCLRIEGVGKESPQGDARAADVLAAMGCRVNKDRESVTVTGPPRGLLRGVDWDCGEMPDVVPTLAVVALFAKGRTRLRKVAHLRHKESDRIASVASELQKLGGKVRELDDGLEIFGVGADVDRLQGASIDTWKDHRIAMAFSVAALVVPDVSLEEPHVVDKSFPGFFAELERLGVQVDLEAPRTASDEGTS